MANFTIESKANIKATARITHATGNFDDTLNELTEYYLARGFKSDAHANRALYNGSRANICGGTAYRKGDRLVVITWDSLQ